MRARTPGSAPFASLRHELQTLEAALNALGAVGRRSDGWSVGEILAHTADLAEVFCERLSPGTFPTAVTTAIRDSAGHIDLARTNEVLRQAHGSDPIHTSLARLDRCFQAAASVHPDGNPFWLQRLDAHTREHLREVWALRSR